MNTIMTPLSPHFKEKYWYFEMEVFQVFFNKKSKTIILISLVEIWLVLLKFFGFLPFSNWPDFVQKFSKIGNLGLKWFKIMVSRTFRLIMS